MPTPLYRAVPDAPAHLSSQPLLKGPPMTMETGFSFSATITTSVLLTPGFPVNRTTTTHGTAQTAELGRRWTISSSLVARGHTICQVYRGTKLGHTDHRLLVGQLRPKLRANQHTKTLLCLDSSLLSDSYTATDFSCSISQSRDALGIYSEEANVKKCEKKNKCVLDKSYFTSEMDQIHLQLSNDIVEPVRSFVY